MLNKYKLLVDIDCPMCVFYSELMVQFGLVDKRVISSYQDFDFTSVPNIDCNRATSEILLYDEINGRGNYGVDAFLTILFHNFPLIIAFFKLPIIYHLLKGLYAFISFNRRVIYPIDVCASKSCQIPFNLFYRWLYILFVALITGIILHQYFYEIGRQFDFEIGWGVEFIICFGQIVWQAIVINIIRKQLLHEYLGNMSSVSLMGGILLIPVIVLKVFFQVHPLLLMVYFGLVVSIMLYEHLRRCRLMGLPIWMTLSWIMYRMFVLLLMIAI